jgi:hypothetical protein
VAVGPALGRVHLCCGRDDVPSLGVGAVLAPGGRCGAVQVQHCPQRVCRDTVVACARSVGGRLWAARRASSSAADYERCNCVCLGGGFVEATVVRVAATVGSPRDCRPDVGGVGDRGGGAGLPSRTHAAGLMFWAKAVARLFLAEWRRILAEWRRHLRASLSLLRASFWSYNLVARCLWVKPRSNSWTSDSDACGRHDLLGGVVSRDIV